jgi:hypothetical protein
LKIEKLLLGWSPSIAKRVKFRFLERIETSLTNILLKKAEQTNAWPSS